MSASASASLWHSRLSLSRGLSVPSSPTHNHELNHASSTARAEEGQLFYLLPNAPKLTSIQYLDRRLFVQLNGSRKVIGVLRGYDVRVLSLDLVARVN